MPSTRNFEFKYPNNGKAWQIEQYVFENNKPNNDFAFKNARRSMLKIVTFSCVSSFEKYM